MFHKKKLKKNIGKKKNAHIKKTPLMDAELTVFFSWTLRCPPQLQHMCVQLLVTVASFPEKWKMLCGLASMFTTKYACELSPWRTLIFAVLSEDADALGTCFLEHPDMRKHSCALLPMFQSQLPPHLLVHLVRQMHDAHDVLLHAHAAFEAAACIACATESSVRELSWAWSVLSAIPAEKHASNIRTMVKVAKCALKRHAEAAYALEAVLKWCEADVQVNPFAAVCSWREAPPPPFSARKHLLTVCGVINDLLWEHSSAEVAILCCRVLCALAHTDAHAVVVTTLTAEGAFAAARKHFSNECVQLEMCKLILTLVFGNKSAFLALRQQHLDKRVHTFCKRVSMCFPELMHITSSISAVMADLLHT